MLPTIRIDDDVYAWLQAQARPFEDTPNSVLRRVAGLSHAAQEATRSGKRQRLGSEVVAYGENTPQEAFRSPILSLLRDHQGEVHRGQALRDLEAMLVGRLTDHDRADIRSGAIRWQKAAEWEVHVMREERLLKPVSETNRGIWALTDTGWEAASKV